MREATHSARAGLPVQMLMLTSTISAARTTRFANGARGRCSKTAWPMAEPPVVGASYKSDTVYIQIHLGFKCTYQAPVTATPPAHAGRATSGDATAAARGRGRRLSPPRVLRRHRRGDLRARRLHPRSLLLELREP